MDDFGGFFLGVYVFVLRPIYLYVLHPVYQYVMRPIFHFIVRPIFLRITTVVGWISWLYGFRYIVMVQGLVCYWRACLYFERSSLWEKLVEKHRKHHDKSYLIPLFWTMNGLFLVFIILLVLATALVGEDNVRRVFKIQGNIGVNLYCLGKSVGELSILRLMVYIGDHVADKSVAEIDIASCFVCAYLSVASLFKLCHAGNDLGFIDGIASVTLSIFTHYCKSDVLRIGGIFICGFAILGKNILFTVCCPPCSQAAAIARVLEDERRGGRGGGGGGGGRRGGGGGGNIVQGRDTSGEVRLSMDDQADVYHSTRSSTSSRRSAVGRVLEDERRGGHGGGGNIVQGRGTSGEVRLSMDDQTDVYSTRSSTSPRRSAGF